MTTNSIYPVVMTDRMAESHKFYAELLELETAFEADWFVHLLDPKSGAQIGLVARGHESIPAAFRDETGLGGLVTIEVEDAAAVYARAGDLTMLLDLRDENWGQRHFITRDPNGVMVDVVELIPVTSEEVAAQYAPSALPS